MASMQQEKWTKKSPPLQLPTLGPDPARTQIEPGFSIIIGALASECGHFPLNCTWKRVKEDSKATGKISSDCSLDLKGKVWKRTCKGNWYDYGCT